jgi:uncharacterized protein (DUF2147 family)
MKKLVIIFCLSLFSVLQAQLIEGSWLTFSDKTGEQNSIVQIFKKTNGKYYGKIIHITKEEDRDNICDKCPEGYSKKEPVMGLEIMRGFEKVGNNKWEGEILDPEDGKIYSCQLSLTEGGKKLKVRGYIGIPLLGRTQIWKKK